MKTCAVNYGKRVHTSQPDIMVISLAHIYIVIYDGQCCFCKWRYLEWGREKKRRIKISFVRVTQLFTRSIKTDVLYTHLYACALRSTRILSNGGNTVVGYASATNANTRYFTHKKTLSAFAQPQRELNLSRDIIHLKKIIFFSLRVMFRNNQRLKFYTA